MLINYRHYTTKELLAILAGERTRYSRRSFAVGGRVRRPDVVSLEVRADGPGFAAGTVVIGCEVNNNLATVRDIVRDGGFLWDEMAESFSRTWEVPFAAGQDVAELLDRVIAGIGAALGKAPLLLYASAAQKALADFHGFMNSSVPKASCEEVLHHLGYWSEADLRDATGNAADCFVAQYRKSRWAAWSPGDVIVPLFPSGQEAIRSLKARLKQCCPGGQIAVRMLPPLKKERLARLYVPTDRTRSLAERVAWLQGEITRLREYDKLAEAE